MSRLNRVLLVIVIILAVATVLVWFKPDLFSSFSLSDLNPFSHRGKMSEVTTVIMPPEATTALTRFPSTESTVTGSTDSSGFTASPEEDTVNNKNAEEEKEVEILSPFEKEIRQRHESYQTKIYTYEPYQPLVKRNPFKRVISTVYLGNEEEERLARELKTEEDIRRFVQPELPPQTKYTGLISSGDANLAIIKMNNETYIVKDGDLILGQYLVESIQNEKVIIEVNGYKITLILGGEDAGND